MVAPSSSVGSTSSAETDSSSPSGMISPLGGCVGASLLWHAIEMGALEVTPDSTDGRAKLIRSDPRRSARRRRHRLAKTLPRTSPRIRAERRFANRSARTDERTTRALWSRDPLLPSNSVGDSSSARPASHILPTIVLAQFAGTSVWFVGNAVLPELAHHWSEISGGLAWVTSSVQLGFIAGTLLFAFSGLSDRVRSNHLFAASAVLAAGANAASMLAPESFTWFMAMRVLTGVSLAGVYPVGMKLAASWFRDGLGSAIGFLVGALVLGTAFPQLLRSAALDPDALVLTASALALAGAIAVLAAVPEGPGVGRGQPGRLRDALDLFSNPGFRSASLGYFGHMWELYAFWAFVPFAVRMVAGPDASGGGWAFAIIGAGSLGCVAGGFASRRWGSARVAGLFLAGSGICCLLSPLVLSTDSAQLGLAFLFLWGVLVAGDSPQFSAVAARSAPPDKVGTGLTIMNALGFALTIPAISLLAWAGPRIPEPWLFMLLLPGPVVGVWALRHVVRKDPTRS